MKTAKLDGIIVIMGPDCSGCGRGGVIYDVFKSWTGFVKFMNESYDGGKENTFTITYDNGSQRTYMRNSNLGRFSHFSVPKNLDGMEVRYPYSWGTVHVVGSWDVHD